MNGPEYSRYLEDISNPEITDIPLRWFRLPIPTTERLKELQRTAGRSVLLPETRSFIDQQGDQFDLLRNQLKCVEAIQFAEQTLLQAEQEFKDVNLAAIQILFYKYRGYAKAEMAKYAELAHLPNGNLTKSIAFVSAAYDYMRSDLVLGNITDVARPMAQCFGAAGMGRLRERTVEKLIGKGNVSFALLPRTTNPHPEIRALEKGILRGIVF